MGDSGVDYYVNHGRTEKFPWTLYHKPIAESLFSIVNDIARTQVAPKILVIGPGAFSERTQMPETCRFTCADIDERVVRDIEKLKDSRVEKAVHVSAASLSSISDQKFDLIYAKEVIEHITNPDEYMAVLYGMLEPGGRVWLSTPNYGFFLLPLLESTILEGVALLDGYSRRDIHPNRYNMTQFHLLFEKCGLKTVIVKEVAFKMALIGIAQK